jgi:hypothetical protein
MQIPRVAMQVRSRREWLDQAKSLNQYVQGYAAIIWQGLRVISRSVYDLVVRDYGISEIQQWRNVVVGCARTAASTPACSLQ